MNPPVLTAAPPKPRKLGCWFYGCTTLMVVVLVGVAALWFGLRYGMKQLREQYTSAQPVAIEHVTLPPSEWTNLQQRVKVFGEALDKGEAQELVLTEQELNAYISNEPKLKKVADSVHVDIEGDQIGGQISYRLPADNGLIKFLGLSGRYLNGDGVFDLDLSNGRLHVYLKKLTVNGQSVPDAQLKELGKTDLAKDMQDPKAQAALQKYESIKVQDGTIILKSKGAPQPSPTP